MTGGMASCIYISAVISPIEHIIVTGPHREKMRLTGLPVTFAAPGGNMMLTGPIGLVKHVIIKLSLQVHSSAFL